MAFAGAGGAVSGATTGAGIGTAIFPGIGTGIGAGIGALVGWLSGRKGDKKNKALEQELMNLLAMQTQRSQSQTPLFNSVTQSAFNRIPAQYRQGLSVPGAVNPTTTGDPLQDLLAQQGSRIQSQQPLMDAIQRLAQARMGVR